MEPEALQPTPPTSGPTSAEDVVRNETASLGHEVKAPILETVGINKTYHVGEAMVSPVVEVSMQIGYGDFAVIFGPSGAGKSTLLNILMGLENPDIGQVFLKGSDLYSYSEEDRTLIRRKRISYLPQAQYWLEHMNMIDNVALPLLLEGMPLRRARPLAQIELEKVGLQDRMRYMPEDLSSGQQQKAALARALIKKPWIIFADEPTAHLDTTSVGEVTETMLRSAEELGITIIMVTHDLEFLKLSKKWFFMRDGRLWDIKDRHNPFNDIKQAMQYVDGIPGAD